MNFTWNSARARCLISLAAMASGLLSASVALADVTRDYSLSGAVFDAFTDYSGAETLSGTWRVDYSTMTVTALALTATGAETLDFNVGSFGSLTSTGGGGATQYEMYLQSTQSTPF